MSKFWKAALIRALRTFCQALLSVIGVSMVMSDVDWMRALSAACLSAILSLLTSVATGLPEVDG